MAVFGLMASPFANALFDPSRIDAQVQGFQRNQLMMQTASKDQTRQGYERENSARVAPGAQSGGPF